MFPSSFNCLAPFLSAWFEHIVGIKNFNFICTRSSWNDEITCILLELWSIYKAWFIGWETFVPIDIFNVFTSTEVPKLKLLVILICSSKNETIMKIDWITTDIWSINGSTRTWLSDIPYLHILIPTCWYDKVWIIFVELNAENSITMARFTRSTTF